MYKIVKRGSRYRLMSTEEPTSIYCNLFWYKDSHVFETEDLSEAKKELDYANDNWTEVQV